MPKPAQQNIGPGNPQTPENQSQGLRSLLRSLVQRIRTILNKVGVLPKPTQPNTGMGSPQMPESQLQGLEPIIQRSRGYVRREVLGICALLGATAILGLCSDKNMTEVLEEREKRKAKVGGVDKKPQDTKSPATASSQPATPKAETPNQSTPDAEKYETFMGVKLKIVTPKHKPDELPALQQSLLKKPGARYDRHTGNVLYGTPAVYMMDEPVVEFEHTLVEGYGKKSKIFNGKLKLKISAAKALIQAEKELGEPIPVREGIRTNQRQKLWYERNNCLGEFAKRGCEKRPYPTAPPGLSEHEKAQAIDIDTRKRAKYKAVLIKYGFLDDTRKDLPHFTFKAIPFTAKDNAISKWNDKYAESPEWKKWIMRQEISLGKILGF